jgi:muramoyltetrapeptide carboxypeptidase LdcA involved in peptidoglycan recycling
MIKPTRLQPGDTLMAVSLSWGGPGAIPHRYEIGKRQLEEALGVRVIESRHALRDPDWIARNPKARADDLMEAFVDSSVQGIVSTIGGDDSIRLLPWIDPGVIAANPKVFLGYSDTTVTHLMCFRTGLVSFYGPSIMAGFAENSGPFPYMIESVRKTLFSAAPPGEIVPSSEWTAEFLDWSDPENQERRRAMRPNDGWRFLQGRGVVEGPLVGGCLDVLELLRGSAAWPDASAFDGAILFLETSEEAPPPAIVARALRSYAANGALRRIAGLLFGRPVEKPDEHDAAILRVIAEEEGLDTPIITRMDFGHTDPMFVLPYGVRARIDCEARTFAVVESAVV